MIVEINPDLFAYIDAAQTTTDDLRRDDGIAVCALREFHGYFANQLWVNNDLAPVPAMLSMQAFMTYCAGVRIALSGHSAAMFPIMRTALEAACYAYLTKQESDLCDVWLKRHSSTEALRACRQAFTPAVARASKAIGDAHLDGAEFIREMYESAIDYGGHPNVRGILDTMSFQEDDPADAYSRLTFGVIYGADSWQTQRTLVGALDFAMGLALILTVTIGPASTERQERLQWLNDLKNEAAREIASDD